MVEQTRYRLPRVSQERPSYDQTRVMPVAPPLGSQPVPAVRPVRYFPPQQSQGVSDSIRQVFREASQPRPGFTQETPHMHMAALGAAAIPEAGVVAGPYLVSEALHMEGKAFGHNTNPDGSRQPFFRPAKTWEKVVLVSAHLLVMVGWICVACALYDPRVTDQSGVGEFVFMALLAHGVVEFFDYLVRRTNRREAMLVLGAVLTYRGAHKVAKDINQFEEAMFRR